MRFTGLPQLPHLRPRFISFWMTMSGSRTATRRATKRSSPATTGAGRSTSPKPSFCRRTVVERSTVLDDVVIPLVRPDAVPRLAVAPLVEPVVEPVRLAAPLPGAATTACASPASDTPGAGAPHLRQIMSGPNRPPHSRQRAASLVGVMGSPTPGLLAAAD